MAKLVKIGNYVVEFDGGKLTFFDASGNPMGAEQEVANLAQIKFPDGEPVPAEALAELLGDAALANFSTAAGGGPPATPTETDSGGGRFTVFADHEGIGGLEAVGGLTATKLQYDAPIQERTEDVGGNPDLPQNLASIPTEDPISEEPTEDEPPADEPPANEPPADEPPADEPPANEPPADPVLYAPEIKATGGSVEFHVTTITGEQNPLGDQKVGDYLTKGGAEGKTIDPTMVNGVDSRNLTLAQGTEVKVGFISEGAGYKSMVGVYTFDADGKVDPSSVKLLWLDASQTKQGVVGGALGKDFLGNSQPLEISLGNLPADTRLGFFIVADGASNKANQKLLASVADVDTKSNNYEKDLNAINGHISFKLDSTGNGQIMVDGKPLAGNIYFTSDKTMNTDSVKDDIEHTLSGVSSVRDGKLYVGFEDLAGGGDRDYQDVVISVDMGAYNINKLTQTVTQPSVDISDTDTHYLAAASIVTHGFQPGDALNIPSSDLFDVKSEKHGEDVTITIIAKDGAESVQTFEDFINHIYFSTPGGIEGDRSISYSVTDTDGLSSNVGTADVHVSSSYEISASEVGKMEHLGSGDDTLHLNQALPHVLDLGDGQDTVHLDAIGMSFGHAEAKNLDNVEIIDAQGAGNNKVSISIEDVLDLTDGDHHLTILGEKGDSLTLTGDGTHHWTATDHGTDFTTYTYDDGAHQAVVEVSNQMLQTVV